MKCIGKNAWPLYIILSSIPCSPQEKPHDWQLFDCPII